jgi:hypothetical protein
MHSINAKMPDNIINVADVLMARLRGQKSLEEPPTIVDLADAAKLCKQRNALAHDGDFVRSAVDLLDADGESIACVD